MGTEVHRWDKIPTEKDFSEAVKQAIVEAHNKGDWIPESYSLVPVYDNPQIFQERHIDYSKPIGVFATEDVIQPDFSALRDNQIHPDNTEKKQKSVIVLNLGKGSDRGYSRVPIKEYAFREDEFAHYTTEDYLHDMQDSLVDYCQDQGLDINDLALKTVNVYQNWDPKPYIQYGYDGETNTLTGERQPFNGNSCRYLVTGTVADVCKEPDLQHLWTVDVDRMDKMDETFWHEIQEYRPQREAGKSPYTPKDMMELGNQFYEDYRNDLDDDNLKRFEELSLVDHPYDASHVQPKFKSYGPKRKFLEMVPTDSLQWSQAVQSNNETYSYGFQKECGDVKWHKNLLQLDAYHQVKRVNVKDVIAKRNQKDTQVEFPDGQSINLKDYHHEEKDKKSGLDKGHDQDKKNKEKATKITLYGFYTA